MKSLLQDLRYGVRALRAQRGFTIVAVLTLALGIGVNTALFTVFNAFVLRPLPLKDPDSLVNFDGANAEGQPNRLFSYLDYLDYRAQNGVLSDVVAWNKVRATLGEAPPNQDDGAALAEGYRYLFGQIVSGNYFTALGAEMTLGQGFHQAEDERPDDQPVVVLSHSCWQRHFGSDSQIAGKSIVLQGRQFTVIGVTAREFVGTTPDVPAFWAPLGTRDRLIQAGGWGHKRWLTDRQTEVFTLLGRLKPGVTRRQAESALQLITDRLAQSYPAAGRKTSLKLASGGTFVSLNEDVMSLVVPLMVGFGLVLLIACANVANLLLARAVGRRREIGVRLALGASRSRVVRQLVTESMLLAVAGGLVGLLLAIWTLSVLYPVVLSSLPLPADLTSVFSLNLSPDWRIFGFTFVMAAVAGIAAGLMPALQSSKPDLIAALKDEGSTFGSSLSQSRLRNALVVAQIAVCLSLLVVASLLIKNQRGLQTVDTGMTTRNVFSLAVGLSPSSPLIPSSSEPSNELRDTQREGELRDQLAEQLRATPGVVAVSLAYRQPLSGDMGNTAVLLPGEASEHPREARYNFVSPEYFAALSISLVCGRSFTVQEAKAKVPLVVVSAATAKRYWPESDPIGKSLRLAASQEPQAASSQNHEPAVPSYQQYEVIGVARDARSRWLWEQDETMIYLALEPRSPAGQYLLVRTADDPGQTMATIRPLAAVLNPSLRTSVRRLEESFAFQMAPFRAIAMIAASLGMLALLLASIGLYGVMSFVVTRRTHEIGIRVALGAKPADVVRMFLFQGLRLTALGMVFGIAGGVLVSRLLATVLIDISSVDPMALVSVSAFLSLVAMLAILIPARRATKVDPLVALRYE